MPDRKTNPIKTRNRVLGKSNPFPSLPMGGNTGEVLVKISDESGEVDWGVVQGDGSVTPPFDPTYLEEKDAEQDDRLDALEAIDPFDPAALIKKDEEQDDRLDALEAAPPGGGGTDYDDTEVRGLIADNADKNDEQDGRLDALENAGGSGYDDTAIWESQAVQDDRLDLLEQMGGDADLWGTYKCVSSSSAPMPGQIRALPLDDKAINIEWFFIHGETLNGNGLPLSEIDPGEHIRLTSPAGLLIDFTVTDVEDRTTYQKVTVDKAATICSDPDSEWSVYWVSQSQVVFSLKQSTQGGGTVDLTDIYDRLDAIEAWIAGRSDSTWGEASGGGF